MGKKDFDEYIESTDNKSTINWEEQRDEWISYLDSLYKKVDGWINEYVSSGKILKFYKEKEIIEENIGTYNVKILELVINNKVVLLDPIGTLLIGAKGRVDLVGPNGKIMFVLVDKNSSGPRIEVKIYESEDEKKEYDRKKTLEEPKKIEWEWKIATRSPRLQYLELNDNSFFDCLMEVING